MFSTIKYGSFDDDSNIAKIQLQMATNNRSVQRSTRWVADIVIEYGTREDGTGWGRYCSLTDYGNAAYAWYHIGKKPFLRFLLECAETDKEYFIKKLMPEDYHIFDLDKSKARAVERIQELVEDNEISEEQEDDFFEKLEAVNDSGELYRWYEECLNDPEGYESFVYGLSPKANDYMKVVLPLLAEVLRKELIGEGEKG